MATKRRFVKCVPQSVKEAYAYHVLLAHQEVTDNQKNANELRVLSELRQYLVKYADSISECHNLT